MEQFLFIVCIIAFFILFLYFEQKNINTDLSEHNIRLENALTKTSELLKDTEKELEKAIEQLKQKNILLSKYEKNIAEREDLLNTFLNSDNLTAFPFIASLIADYKTLDLQHDIDSLSWGDNKERRKKVASLTVIKNQLKDIISEYKNIQYQLDYLKVLYPGIDDILETSYTDLKINSLTDVDTDPVRNYLSSEEFHSMSSTERNQLALDRYIQSHSKSKWQIGRDYELYVGYMYSTHGYTIDYFGSYMGLEDLGRDLIATRGNEVLIIQCKYWSKEKTIHEKHIAQLFGTYISYCIENNVSSKNVHPVFITSTNLSEQAKKFCNHLHVSYKENFPLGEYPRIKCNVGKDEYGDKTYIYHLPMDQQYDNVKINSKDECMAFTVQEAESKGFRRAYRWHNN